MSGETKKRLRVRTDYEALDYLMGYHNSHVAWLLYPIDCANLLINTMLLVASALCWKLQRKRLLLLSCALVTEVIFVNLIVAMGASRGFF